jgi:hypothetical protein
MKKFLLLGFLSMFGASQAHAGFVNITTGADMAGLQVTATFSSGFTETLTWQVVSAGNGLTDTINLETQIGGVTGSGWSLNQQGDSQGNTDTNGTPTDFTDDTIYGLWTLTNSSALTLQSVIISTLGTDVVFDSEFVDNLLNGSGIGREFTPELMTSGATGIYSDPIQDELFSTLTINLDLAGGSSLEFLADTDVTTVPVPATLSLLLLGLGGLVIRRKQA